MIPGKLPGPSGQAAKVGILPFLVVMTTSFSIIDVSLRADPKMIADRVARSPPCCHPLFSCVRSNRASVDESRDTPSPRLRGEGWGEGLLHGSRSSGGNLPLTRHPRCARLPTSPRKRGEVIGRAVHSMTLAVVGNHLKLVRNGHLGRRGAVSQRPLHIA